MSLTPSVMEWKLSHLYGTNLPLVSLIPGVKLTRSKDYHMYHVDITAFTGDRGKPIVKNLHLDATREHKWLDSIQPFTAAFETRIKFEIYGHRLGPRKHVATAEKTMQNILDARDGDGVVKLQLDSNYATSAKLVLKIRSVSDEDSEGPAVSCQQQ